MLPGALGAIRRRSGRRRSARFENLVARHLLQWVRFEQDTYGRELELRQFGDIDGREASFVVVEGRRPVLPAGASGRRFLGSALRGCALIAGPVECFQT